MDVFYDELHAQAAALMDGEPDAICNMANLSCLLYHALNRRGLACNWCGFYRAHGGGGLVLGPFHGQQVACLRIPAGKGVCGRALQLGSTVVVPDVHAFPGHIACDSGTRSEMVLPVRDPRGHVIGVLDVDSLTAGAFAEADRVGLERIVALFAREAAEPAGDQVRHAAAAH